jgi:hypothetical protein
MVSTEVFLGVLTLLVVLISLILLQKKGHPSKEQKNEKKTVGLKIGTSSLVEFAPTNKFESRTIETVSDFIRKGKPVILVSQAPRTKMYFERLQDSAEKGELKIVGITSENPMTRPQMFRVVTPNLEEKESKKELITLISIHNLEYLTEIIGEIPKGGTLVFESMTGLILALGKDRKETAYKFFASIVEEMSVEERTLIALINKNAHDHETLSAYEGLFLNILKLEGDSLTSLKEGRSPTQNDH